MCAKFVEHQTRYGDIADIGEAGRGVKVPQWRVGGMKRQRNEGLKTAGVILESAQFQQVVHAVFVILNMAVEHGGVGAQADLVGHAGGLQPLAAVNLVIADNVAHALGKNLRSTTGHGLHPGFLQLHKRVADAQLGDLGQKGNLHHGERLQVHLRESLLQSGDELQEVLERQIGMQASDNVELGHGFGVAGSGGLPDLLQRHGVGAGPVFLAAKGAEAAGGYADIRGIDVPVDVEVSHVPMHALAHMIRQPANGQDVGRTVKGQCVIAVEALSGQDFVGNGAEARVVRLEGFVHGLWLGRHRHHSR